MPNAVPTPATKPTVKPPTKQEAAAAKAAKAAAHPEFNIRYLLISRRWLLLTVAAIILGLVLVMAVIVPQVQAALTTYQDWQKERAAVAKLEKKAADLQQVSTSLAFAKADQVNQALPSKKPLLELLSGLSQVATQTKVNFTNIELSPGSIASTSATTDNKQAAGSRNANKKKAATANREYDDLEVQIRIEGELSQINQFLDQVEKLAPATTITSLTLDKKNRTGAVIETFEAEVVLTSFYFTKSVSAALEAPLPPLGDSEEQLLSQLDTYIYPSVQAPQQIQGGGQGDLFAEDTIDLESLQTLQGLLPRPSPRPTNSPSPSPVPDATIVPSPTVENNPSPTPTVQ
jgi:Tfp pilus assembly protein PilO